MSNRPSRHQPNNRDGPAGQPDDVTPRGVGQHSASKEPVDPRCDPAAIADRVLAGQRFQEPARLVGAQPSIKGRGPILMLTGSSLLALVLIFPPVEWWWLAFVALVPWLVCVCSAAKARFAYLTSFLLGVGFYLIHIRWMIPVTAPGYLALCLAYAVFFPLAAWPIRHMYRRHGVSVALTAPVAWVAVEYLRSIGPLGFPFLLLGHSQYQVLTMIQISDLVGAYGVSFVLAMVNGWITDLLIQPILVWRSERGARLPVGSLTTLLVLLGTVIYGSSQRSARYFTPGPRVAVVQHDFAMYVTHHAYWTPRESVFQAYLELARKAAKEKPDLILLPETAMACYANEEFLTASPDDLDEIRQRRFTPQYTREHMLDMQRFSRTVRDGFQQLSTEYNVPIVLGATSLEWRPTAIPPDATAFNSAFLLLPGREQPAARYDKIHLVLFGEYVPFRLSYRPLYDWLNARTPWGREGIEYSLAEGDRYEVFEIPAASQNHRVYRAAVPICYEEIMPYITREFVRGVPRLVDRKNIDMLLTISNDGWFLHTAELQQHLAAAVFRAVEHRIPIARSVNTGASAQIHPNGRIHRLITLDEELRPRMKAVEAALRKIDEVARQMEPVEAELLEATSRLNRRQAGQASSTPEDAVDLRERIKAAASRHRELLALAIAAFDQDLCPAVEQLGPEFAYLAHRQGNRLAHLATPLGSGERTSALPNLRLQLADDLQSLARWQTQAGMAPGYLIADLQCDERITLYTRWGDWFSQAALVLWGIMLLDWLLRRLLKPATGRGLPAVEEQTS